MTVITEGTPPPAAAPEAPAAVRPLLPAWLKALLVAGVVVLVVIYPDLDFTSGYRLRFATFLAMWIGLASSWNLLGGFTGYVDFGHVVFFGLGGYGVGMLMVKQDLPFWLALPLGGVAAGVFALVVGAPTLRLRGPYFSIAMLGMLVAVREIVRSLTSVTGGGSGLSLPIDGVPSYEVFFYLMAATAGGIVAIAAWVRRSQFGLQLAAIREDEVAAGMKGIDVARVKLSVFVLSACCTGLLGGINAYWVGYIVPKQVFLESYTVQMIMMALAGGLGTVGGPVLGAIILYWLEQTLWANFLDWHQLILGLLLITLIYLLPEGLLGAFGRRGVYSVRRLVDTWVTSRVQDER